MDKPTNMPCGAETWNPELHVCKDCYTLKLEAKVAELRAELALKDKVVQDLRKIHT